MREERLTPHVAQQTTRRRSAIDGRTTWHPGYAVSQRRRKRVEEIFGWDKTVGLAANAAPGPAPRRLEVHLRPGRVQLGADSEPDMGGSGVTAKAAGGIAWG